MNSSFENQKTPINRQPGHGYPQRQRHDNSGSRFGRARDASGGKDRDMGTRNSRDSRDSRDIRSSRDPRNSRDSRDSKDSRDTRDPRSNRGAKDYQGQPQQGYYHPGTAAAAAARYAPRYRAEETLEDIRSDIQRLEKEIDLEIKEIKSLRLGL